MVLFLLSYFVLYLPCFAFVLSYYYHFSLILDAFLVLQHFNCFIDYLKFLAHIIDLINSEVVIIGLIELCLSVFMLLCSAHPLILGLSLTNWIWQKWCYVRSQSKILKGLVASTFILSGALSLHVRSLAVLLESHMQRPFGKAHGGPEALRLCRRELRKCADSGDRGPSMWPQLSGPASTRWLSHTSTDTGQVNEKKKKSTHRTVSK